MDILSNKKKLSNKLYNQKKDIDFYTFMNKNKLLVILTLQLNSYKKLMENENPNKTNKMFITSLKNKVTRELLLSMTNLDNLKKEVDQLKYKYYFKIMKLSESDDNDNSNI